jgi:DNA-binding NarL/FixJ family response regulator
MSHATSRIVRNGTTGLRRASAAEVTEAWRGLVEGRWSLVGHVDSDNKRFLFAKRNAPDLRPWHMLTKREQEVLAYAAQGQSHKLIGYALAICESTIARHLTTAARKVGARSRIELLAAYRAMRALAS